MSKWMVILVHGFNVYDGGRKSTAKLRPFFAEHNIPYLMVEYVHSNPFSSRVKNDNVAKLLTDACTNANKAGYRVAAVGHSNGCAIISVATKKYMAPIERCIYINPALEKHTCPGKQVQQFDVWHSPGDRAVKLSKWLPFSSARPWGEMGATGYIGTDTRCSNFNKQKDFPVRSKSHSDMFDVDNLAFFGPMIANSLE